MSHRLCDHAQRRLGSDTLPGEHVLHAVTAHPVDGTGTAELDLPPRCVVAVSTRRLLVFEAGGLFTVPKILLYAYRFRDLVAVRRPWIDDTGDGSLEITVELADTVLRWRFTRSHLPDGYDLLDELRQHAPED